MPTNIEKLIAVGDISFTVVREGSTIDISVSNAQSVNLNGNEVLSVTVGMSRDGTSVELDNPFQYVRPVVEVRGTESIKINGANSITDIAGVRICQL